MSVLSARQLNRSTSGTVFLLVFISAVSFFMMLPLIYVVGSSLKPTTELWIFPPRMLPNNPTLSNYRELFSVMSDSAVPFSRYIFNTVFMTLVGTAGHVVISSMCAFAICKIRFDGANIVFQIIVYSLMFGASVTAIPGFLVLSRLHLVDTYWAIILPAFSSSMGLYLMKQFMETMVHDSLLEAARIDGAGNWKIFWKIVMPLVRPAWLTLIIFSFQNLWNVGSTNVIFSEEFKSLNYAVSQIVSSGIARAGAGTAATVIMMIVPIVFFIFSQSKIVETMGTSGMKD